ncbi:universal stress protein [Actinotalea sp. AC32]|nr:universal stress protein [Actinotalea sp. AC32]
MDLPVVVGVSATGSSDAAVRWAASAAADRGAPLVLLHAVGPDVPVTAHLGAPTRAVLASAADAVRAEAPSVTVTTEVSHERAGHALTRASGEAQLVVVGTHRLTAAERVLGSRAYQVVAGSDCAVAVVPALPEPDADRVVVGSDGSAHAAAAVRAAAVEAERTGSRLVVVHAWERPPVYAEMGVIAGGFEEGAAAEAAATLTDSLASVERAHPALHVRPHLVQGVPARALLDEAAGARLLVVGSRGLHGVARMLLGSVSHAVLLRAPCPVLVVRR